MPVPGGGVGGPAAGGLRSTGGGVGGGATGRRRYRDRYFAAGRRGRRDPQRRGLAAAARPAHGGNQQRVNLADLAGLDLDVLAPGLEPVLAPDLQHVMPRADARRAEVRARLLSRGLLDGRFVQPHQSPRRVAGQLEAGVGRRFQRHRQRQRLPRLELDVLVVAGVPVARDRKRVGARRPLDRHRRLVAHLDVVDQNGGVPGRRGQLDPPRLDGAVVPVDHRRRWRPPPPPSTRRRRGGPGAAARPRRSSPVPNGACSGSWNRCALRRGRRSASACAAAARRRHVRRRQIQPRTPESRRARAAARPAAEAAAWRARARAGSGAPACRPAERPPASAGARPAAAAAAAPPAAAST